MPSLESWLTKDQAAAELEVSTKTVERYADQGRIQAIPDPVRTLGRPRRLFNSADVKRIWKELREERPSPTALWVDLERAVKISGLPRDYIERAVAAGALRAHNVAPESSPELCLRVRRADLGTLAPLGKIPVNGVH